MVVVLNYCDVSMKKIDLPAIINYCLIIISALLLIGVTSNINIQYVATSAGEHFGINNQQSHLPHYGRRCG